MSDRSECGKPKHRQHHEHTYKDNNSTPAMIPDILFCHFLHFRGKLCGGKGLALASVSPFLPCRIVKKEVEEPYVNAGTELPVCRRCQSLTAFRASADRADSICEIGDEHDTDGNRKYRN